MDLVERGTNKKIRLNDRQHFVAAGGEAKVFAKGDVGFKIFLDPKKMIPLQKIDELSVLTDPNIIKPETVLLNSRKKPVGYTMRFIEDTIALCQAFTRAFKERSNFSPADVFSRVRNIQSMLFHIHSHKMLAVDINEMNLLLSHDFTEVFWIDTNSFQTLNFPATAIMEAIRDHQSKKFTENTDWFSFAVTSFQFLIGIHPYKGRHPDYGKRDLDKRMQDNVSVFNPKIKLPAVCYPFDVIPDVYRKWYEAVLERGERCAPPKELVAVATIIAPKVAKVVGTDIFEIQEIADFAEEVLSAQFVEGIRIVLCSSYIYTDGKIIGKKNKASVAITPLLSRPVAVSLNNERLDFTDIINKSPIQSTTACKDFMTYDGRVYSRHGTAINEIEFVEIGANVSHAVGKPVANVLEQSTQMFDGVVVQNLLGAYYVSLFPESGKHYQVRIKELDAYRIIDAKFDNKVLMIVGEKAGKYDRFVFRFSSDYSSYDQRVIGDVAVMGLNFVVLDNGICASINEDEELELFANKKDAGDIKTIDDPAIKSDMKLFKDGVKLIFAKGKVLFRIKMK
tara:strand:- start:2078 stop:3769 length:1692 start_codon:yes stop_codon:yes gene_type:complete